MRTQEWEVIHSPFFGGWVVKTTIIHTDGPYKGTYVDFPQGVYGVLDSMTVTCHKSKGDALASMEKLKCEMIE